MTILDMQGRLVLDETEFFRRGVDELKAIEAEIMEEMDALAEKLREGVA